MPIFLKVGTTGFSVTTEPQTGYSYDLPDPYVPPKWSGGAFDRSSRPSTLDTSVHPLETNLPQAHRDTEWGGHVTSDDHSVTFRHSGWAGSRRKVRQALVTSGTPPRRLERFDLCGSDPWVAVDESDPNRMTILTNHCKSRWCVPCSRERAHRIVGHLRTKLTDRPARFLTLTMKHSDTPLRAQIDRIYSSFRRLRKATFWKRCVVGGAAVLEIKHGHHDGLWHVHLHCLLEGSYVRHADLKAEWWRITGDSNIVDIRPVPNSDVAARYVTKYITKPIPSTLINRPPELCELITACSGRRLVLTWGTWRGLKLSAPLDATSWKSICPLTELYALREAGNLDAFTTLQVLERQVPGASAIAGRGPPAVPLDLPHPILPEEHQHRFL